MKQTRKIWNFWQFSCKKFQTTENERLYAVSTGCERKFLHSALAMRTAKNSTARSASNRLAVLAHRGNAFPFCGGTVLIQWQWQGDMRSCTQLLDKIHEEDVSWNLCIVAALEYDPRIQWCNIQEAVPDSNRPATTGSSCRIKAQHRICCVHATFMLIVEKDSRRFFLARFFASWIHVHRWKEANALTIDATSNFNC